MIIEPFSLSTVRGYQGSIAAGAVALPEAGCVGSPAAALASGPGVEHAKISTSDVKPQENEIVGRMAFTPGRGPD
jgi:hypothetical protein